MSKSLNVLFLSFVVILFSTRVYSNEDYIGKVNLQIRFDEGVYSLTGKISDIQNNNLSEFQQKPVYSDSIRYLLLQINDTPVDTFNVDLLKLSEKELNLKGDGEGSQTARDALGSMFKDAQGKRDGREVNVSIFDKDGNEIILNTKSLYFYMLPWHVSINGRKFITYNPDLSIAVSRFLPDLSINKALLSGDGLKDAMEWSRQLLK